MEDLENIIRKYLDRGWGSMNKNDFEVWIFNQILQIAEYETLNDYELSVKLQLPQTKVKRLRYEAALKYPKNTNYSEEFRNILKKARCKKESVEFSIESVAVRQYLCNELKKDGRLFDYSFNSEIVRVSCEDYMFLVKRLLFDEETKKECEKKINNEKINEIVPLIVQSIASALGGNVATSVGQLANYGLNKTIEFIKLMKSGKNSK